MDKEPKPERITGKYLLNNLLNAFEIKKGFIFTFRELTFRPGLALREYISSDRSKIINPIKYALLSITLIFIYNYLEKITVPAILLDLRTEFSAELVTYGTSIIYTLVFALIMQLFFKRKGYNFYEHLVVIILLFSNGLIITSLVFDFGKLGLYLLTDNKVLYLVDTYMYAYAFITLYFIWAIQSFLQTSIIRVFLLILTANIFIVLTIGFYMNFIGEIDEYDETWIGIKTGSPKEEMVLYNQYKLGKRELTLLVDSVLSESPAFNAGIVSGDTIVKMNGERTDPTHFTRFIKSHIPGDTVVVTITSNGIMKDLSVVLAHRDSIESFNLLKW